MTLIAVAAHCGAWISAANAQAVPERSSRTATARTFNADVVEMSTEITVFASFWSAACRPCRAFRPQLERVLRSVRNDVRLVFIDIDENPDLAIEYNIGVAPVTLAFQDGVVIGRLPGAATDEQVKSFAINPSMVPAGVR
jgi:thioredoxin 1